MFTKLISYKKLLVVLPQLIALSSFAQKSFTVSSPNKKLSAICTISKNGDATYNILYLQQPILEIKLCSSAQQMTSDQLHQSATRVHFDILPSLMLLLKDFLICQTDAKE